MYADFVPARLAQLRTQKGVSARDMSLSLGQANNYINVHPDDPSGRQVGLQFGYRLFGTGPVVADSVALAVRTGVGDPLLVTAIVTL